MVKFDILNIVERFKTFLYVAFFLFLPISQRISTIFIIALLVISLFSYNRTKVYLTRELTVLILFYFLYGISLFYSSQIQTDILEKKASFLAFPIIFMFDKDLKKHLLFALKYYIFGCIVAVFLCEVNAIINATNFHELTFNSQLDKNLGFFDSIAKNKNYFFAKTFSFIHQTVYFSMYLVFGILVLNSFKLFNKKVTYIISILFIIVVFQILNKAGIIVLFIVFGIKLWFSIQSIFKRAILLVLLGATAIMFFLLNPRLKNFNINFNYNKPDKMVSVLKAMPNTNRVNTNSRVLIWVSALELIKENPLYGIGAGGSHKTLYERVAFNQQHYDKRYKVHAHNQYLQVWLDTGVIGFVLFAIFFVYLIKYSLSDKLNANEKMFIVGFLLIISVNFMFESMFERYSGISFFCGFYCLIISEYYEKVKLKTN